MTRCTMLLVAACVLLLTTGCGNSEFKEYTSVEGRYKVQMPGKPKVEMQNAQAPNGQKIALNAASLQRKNGVYAVTYSDLPIPAGESAQQTEDRLDVLRDGALKNTGGKLTKEIKITLAGKYPGRDIEAELPGGRGSLRVKMYMVGIRLYQVMAMGSSSWVSSADSAQFLDSFALVE